MLQRRQLMLDDKVVFELMEIARSEGRSFSDLAREALEEKVKIRKNKRGKKVNAAVLLLKTAERAERENWVGPVDLSTNDDYIY